VSGYYKIFTPGPILGKLIVDKTELELLDCEIIENNCADCNPDATICYECDDDDLVTTDGNCA